MFVKRFFHVLLCVPLCLSVVKPVWAEEPPKLVSLGLSAATAMASQKDVVKGLKQAAADEYTSWLWDAVGGTEKFMTGNAEAEIPAAKDKIMKIVTTVQAIEKFAIAVTEGRYDDAAFTTIDEVVGTLNHPLVSVTWEMAKLTYESHKLVVSTGAERDIEAMYGIVANDRRIMGVVDPNSDSPAQIPVNAQTADYFFNKYIVTDGGARDLMKSYVTTHLGEEWPEESWSSYLNSWRSVGSGVDTAKNAEIEMLAGEWRNKARGWIVQLLNDANKQAKVYWGQVRLRQQLAEFKRFSDRVGHFYNGDMDRMIGEFLAIKANKGAEKELANLPEKSQKAHDLLKPLISKFEGKDLRNAPTWDVQINDWQLACLSAASRMESVNKILSSTIYAERKKWLNLADELSKKVNEQKGQISQGVIAEEYKQLTYQYGSLDYNRSLVDHVKELYEQHFADLFAMKFDWASVNREVEVLDINGKSKKISLSGSPAIIVEKAVEQLNIGDFKGANRIIEFWTGDYWNNEDRNNDDVKHALWQYENDIKKQINERLAGAFSGFINEEWERKKLKKMCFETLGQMMALYDMQYKEAKDSLLEASGSFKDLALTLRKKVAQFSGECETILKLLPTSAPLAGNSWFMEEEIKAVNEDGYTHMASPKDSGTVKARWMAQFIGRMVPSMNDRQIVNRLLFTAAEIEKRSVGWSEGEQLFKNLTRFNTQEMQQCQVLVDPSFDPDAVLEKIRAAIDYANVLRQVPQKLKAAAKKAEADQLNREIDSDFISAQTLVIDTYFRELQEAGLIKLGNEDYEVVLPKPGRDGRIRIEEPFAHYAMSDELKEFGQPLRGAWGKMKAASFVSQYAPQYVARWHEIMNLTNVPAAKEKNFIAPNFDLPIYKSDLDKAWGLVEKLKGSDERYMSTMAEVAKLVPGLMQVPTVIDQERDEMQAKLYGMTLEKFYETTGKNPAKSINYLIDTKANDAIKFGLLDHDLGKIYSKIGQRVKELYFQKVDHEAAIQNREAKAQAEAYQKEQNKKSAATSKAMLDKMAVSELAGYYGYGIEDARLNSKSLRNAYGDVVLTRQDLIAGKMALDIRLLTTDKMQTILLSEDGGRTWQELAVSKMLTASIDPLPGKTYDFVLRVKTTDQREVTMPVFSGVNSITYQDVDFAQLVAQTVKDIAEAYERQDVMSFSDQISRDYLGNKAILEEGVRFDFDLFSSIRLTLYINRIEQRGNMFVAETKWDKSQNPRTTGQEQRTSGMTTIMFVMEDGKMKIKNLRGDLIYATLSPQIAQASGKSATVVDRIRTAQEARNPEQPGAAVTEDAGGVISGSVSSAPLITKTATMYFQESVTEQSLDFTDTVSDNKTVGDGWFFFDEFVMNGSAQIEPSAVAYDSLTTAPEPISGSSTVLVQGATYVFITKEGYYGKMEITSLITGPYSMQCRYTVQTNGSSDLVTQ